MSVRFIRNTSFTINRNMEEIAMDEIDLEYFQLMEGPFIDVPKVR